MSSVKDIPKILNRFACLMVVVLSAIVLVMGMLKDSHNIANIVGPLVLGAFSIAAFLWSELWMPFVFTYWREKKAPLFLTQNSSLFLGFARLIGILISCVMVFILVSGLIAYLGKLN